MYICITINGTEKGLDMENRKDGIVLEVIALLAIGLGLVWLIGKALSELIVVFGRL